MKAARSGFQSTLVYVSVALYTP